MSQSASDKSKKSAKESCRLDKWLWAARFFKTRSLAKNAVEHGKVHYQGQRVKASKEVNIGSNIRIKQGYSEKDSVVTGISLRRGSAIDAARLYYETPQSIKQRENACEQRKLASLGESKPNRRPNKHDRRKIIKFQQDQ